MTINLPDDLQSFVSAKVQSGQFPSEEATIAEALRRFRLWEQEQTKRPVNPGIAPESDLGSIGAMKDDADLMDEIVAEAYRQRREEPWREFDL